MHALAESTSNADLNMGSTMPLQHVSLMSMSMEGLSHKNAPKDSRVMRTDQPKVQINIKNESIQT